MSNMLMPMSANCLSRCPSGDPDLWPGSIPHCGNAPRAAACGKPLHLHPMGPPGDVALVMRTRGCADDFSAWPCSLHAVKPQALALLHAGASLPAPRLLPRLTAFAFLPQQPRPDHLSCGYPVPCTPQEKNAALQKQGKNKAEKSSFVLFSFLGHFEIIKECDLNYKYPPSRMIYGLFVLDWYVLNL